MLLIFDSHATYMQFRELLEAVIEKSRPEDIPVPTYTQLGIALAWLGEGHKAEMYLKKAVQRASDRQV